MLSPRGLSMGSNSRCRKGETIDLTGDRRPGKDDPAPCCGRRNLTRGVSLSGRAEGDVGSAILRPGAMGLTACSDSGTSHAKVS
jgi:hypothetical protein